MSPEAAYEAAEWGFLTTNPSNDFVLPVYSLIRGVKVRRMLGELFGRRRIDELPLRLLQFAKAIGKRLGASVERLLKAQSRICQSFQQLVVKVHSPLLSAAEMFSDLVSGDTARPSHEIPLDFVRPPRFPQG